jgi:prevent-host-death family protein
VLLSSTDVKLPVGWAWAFGARRSELTMVMDHGKFTGVGLERIAISEFKATCLAVLERVRKTRVSILITKRGQPVAQIGPPPEDAAVDRRVHGCMAGTAKIVGDIVEPVATDDWEGLQ